MAEHPTELHIRLNQTKWTVNGQTFEKMSNEEKAMLQDFIKSYDKEK